MTKHIKTIPEFHQYRGLPKPEHPLISVIDIENVQHWHADEPMNLALDFYVIALKRVLNTGKVSYGQGHYYYDEGIMSFMSPHQIFSISKEKNESLKQSGWVLLVHPDFLWNSALANKIKQYEYFEYAANEALMLSENEEKTIVGIIENIQQEYHANIDTFSQDIIIAHLETLFNYADRFYHRQFLKHKKVNHQILERFEKLMLDYFRDVTLTQKGLPTVQYISEELNVSVSYLSRLLKTLTGQSTQQHIHDLLIEKAKERLATTELTVGEIAYELGFEHSQSFSKLFKLKTNQSPMEFRQSFN
ncbi:MULTISPECIES: AraC family transcriptional regulator [unclassified Leeuwenhoekiella]|uniref:helix-turn-helix domain-containing protein n=1 Tax=unclassified Leeuwenhoekiella TaxID=2615029 RepID=UPI000C50A4EF|nr:MULTISPECIES: response regulator transcription factor [unclassified Leeuwenhoekiella]MAW96569.1 AraC family transcriptional regulator [Leeuwenhoekiella sp.]MBA81457.1 AraC family transcriptional regulator [Leeuwenhoekiella sp.]|tara:strand:+ start:3740 stop:4651 length:912 start_codon:yes stop_codon:yes gene_type:complete